MNTRPELWPALPLAEWQATLDTLHLYAQIAGKIRLKLAPAEPEWAHVALSVSACGLTTGPMLYGARTFEMEFDLTSHRLVIKVSDGQHRVLDLQPQTVARFYHDVMAALRELDIDVSIWTMPQEIPGPIPFEQDETHGSYDRAQVERFWQVLSQVDGIFKQHRAGWRGRHTPVQFFWGGFDLAYARFSGKSASPPPGANLIMRLGMDAEEVNAGFWSGDARFSEAAFFAYGYPQPADLEKAVIKPSTAFWAEQLRLFILRYEDVRTASSPRDLILQFLGSTFDACASAPSWKVPR